MTTLALIEDLDGSKLKYYSELKKELKQLRKDGKKNIHCHGVFDLLHPGHIEHFKQAKKMVYIL